MKFSGYNIFSRIRGSENSFIVNLLTGNADILAPEEAEKIEAIINGISPDNDGFSKELSDRGYFVDEAEEKKLYRNRYLDFIDGRESDEIQIFLVTNYSCNFACSYCYQDQYVTKGPNLTEEIIDAFFRYVENAFTGRKKYITIFGGEPLLGSPRQKELISLILDKAEQAGLELSIVTNGYTLKDYVPLFTGKRIREIQVTLDGTAEFHDRRRFLKGGEATFGRIVEGIDACLQSNIGINLRMVVDKENITNLPALAGFAIEKGWTANPLFKTQMGRNYELHHCQSAPDKLFTRVSLYEKVYELVKQHPHILEFYKPAYSVSKFLWENGELPEPLFDACPACKTEWAFDYTGGIFSCTATVGKADELLGTFYPEVTLKDDIVAEWESRDVTSIPECSSCSLQLACGGGCGSVAKNRTGKICSTDCRPVRELLELGFAAYLDKTED